MQCKLKWKINKLLDDGHVINFPFYSILFAICFEQVLISLFCVTIFDSIVSYIMIAGIIILDVISLAVSVFKVCGNQNPIIVSQESELIQRPSTIQLQ